MHTITIEQVKRLANYLSPEDKLHLADFLHQQAGKIALRPKPQSLRGTWKDAFPADLNLDQELKNIRSEWEKELEENEFK